MDVTEAISRVKGLLMIAADRTANGDQDGAAAAALIIVDTLEAGGVQASDIEAAIAGDTQAAGLAEEVDAFADSMSEEDDSEEEEGPETEEDDAIEEGNTIAKMKARALEASKS